MNFTYIKNDAEINAVVNYKIGLFENRDKNFENLFDIMFMQEECVMYERTDGYKIIKTTYGQCKEEINRIAKAISVKLFDCKKGSMVGIHMQNSLEWIEIFWGLLMNGYKPLLMNTRLDNVTLNKVLDFHKVAAVISDGTQFEVPTFNCEDVVRCESDGVMELHWADELIVMSSGTSENIKLCVYNGESFYYQLCNTVNIIKESKDIKKHYEGQLKLLTFLPFYHIFGLAAVYMWFGFFSRTFVQLNDLSADTLLNTIKKHKVTHIFAVPLLWNRVYEAAVKKIKARGEKTYNKAMKGISLAEKLDFCPALSKAFSKKAFKEVRENLFGESISFLIAGGSSISPEVMRFFNGIGYTMADGFGMSEVGITSVETSKRAKIRNSCSVGKPFKHVEYMLSEEGELMVRGKCTAVRIVTVDGEQVLDANEWFGTKDLAKEINGRYYILGRKDDMIVCKTGENLNPDRVEASLSVPGAIKVALIAKTYESGEKSPVLLVQVNNYASADRIIKVLENVREQLKLNKLDGTINEIVMTTTSLMGENDFKLNRKKLIRKYMNNELDVVNPEKVKEQAEELPEELVNRLRTFFADALGMEADEIMPDSHFFYDLEGSSLDYLAMLAELQKEFEISFSIEDDMSLSTVKEFCRYIQENL